MTGGLLQDCLITGNRMSYNNNNGQLYGAGIHMTGGLVDRCIVAANTNSTTGSILFGGGVYMDGSSTLQNTLVYGNVIDGANDSTKNRGGGVYMNATGCQVLNCTIVDNAIGLNGNGGGLYQNKGYVTNTIVYFNTIAAPNATENAFISASGTSFDYSCITPAVSGTDNTAADPLFNNRPNRDYTLSSLSTLINAGVILDGVTNDLAGLARPEGDSHDIGAYEAPPAGGEFVVSFSALPTEVIALQDVVFSALLGGDNTSGVYYRWDFNDDGNVDLEGYDLAVVTNNLYAPGYYTVRLTASNAVEDVAESLSAANYIRIAPPIVYVATNGFHVVPFDTLQKAATNLQDAINEALITSTATSMVRVAPGVYNVTTPVLFNKGITVSSSDGPESTVFRKSDSVTYSRIFEITDANAVLDGVTVRDARFGTLEDNSSAGILLVAGLVQNCILTANLTSGRWGWGGGIEVRSGGTLRSSLVVGNRVIGFTSNGNAGGGGIYLNGGRVENCTVVGNQAGGSTGTVQGGGIYRSSGTITNTIIYFNTVDGAGKHDLYATAGVGFTCASDVTHDPAGTGNMTNNPAFVVPGSDYGDNHVFGNYRLLAASPAVDTGTNQTWMASATDLDGNNRIMSRIVDMGAYETESARGTIFTIR